MMRMKRHLYDAMVAHALATYPDECCGLIASRHGEAISVHPCTNAQSSGSSFLVDPDEQIELLNVFHDAGLELGAIFHSHPGMRPIPSGIDTDYGRAFPGVMWIIVGWDTKWRVRVVDDDEEDNGKGRYKWQAVRADPDVWAWTIDANERIYTAELVVERSDTTSEYWRRRWREDEEREIVA